MTDNTVLARDSHNGMIDAFRIVARELCYNEPNSRVCLWSTLELTDKFESQTLGMDNTMIYGSTDLNV